MTAFVPVLSSSALRGRRIFVTGAGTGLGRAIARRLAQLGAEVGGCGRRAEPLRETAAIIAAEGGDFRWRTCDVRDLAGAEEVLREFASERGLHGLVNNAGGQFHARAESISDNGWRSVVDLNLNAVFALSRAAHPLLKASGGGAILNISIAAVDRGGLGLAHAVAARSGVAGLSKALALEWGRDGIAINCLAPAAVDTEAFVAKSTASQRQTLTQASPAARNATAAEVAELAAFLLSPAATLITGQVIRIDGGAFLGAPIDLRPTEEAA